MLLGLDAEVLLMGLTIFAINLYAVYLVVFQVGFFFADATARTRITMQVFFSNEPKLTNLGFMWPPMPMFLQFPLVLIPALRYKGLSGNVVTAVMGIGAALMLMLFLRHLRIPVVIRWLIVATFVCNPMILLYSANGMSEITFSFFVLLAVYCFYRWHETNGRWTFLTGCGLAMAGAFLTRYESVIVFTVFGALVAWQAFLWHFRNPHYIESVIFLYGAPVAYAVFLWLLGNYLIMGDPLYFARGPYSNAGTIGPQLAALLWVVPLKGNLLASVQRTLADTWYLFPAFYLLSGTLFIAAIWKRVWIGLYILAIAWSFIGFLILNVYMGQAVWQLRMMLIEIPMAFVIGIGILNIVTRWRGLVAILLCFTFALSSFSTFDSMWISIIGQRNGSGEGLFVHSLVSGQRAHDRDNEQKIAAYIVNNTRGKVLADDSQGTFIVFFSESPQRFITQGDSVFDEFLDEPFRNVEYVLITDNKTLDVGTLNLIDRAYPNLYRDGASWATLEKQVGVWKLYRVIGSPNRVPFKTPSSDISPPR
ncbi:MAG: phospholipid carrier-dependent glycosyltransferase [Chloroflexi bacterium]|nr:phospholipid carrier-dependent glycosyltransferase [Chloroflexota bacterium]